MESSIGSELVHLHCGNCGQTSSVSLQSLENGPAPDCPYCGARLPVDLRTAERDANREAHELDADVDALGSVE